MTAMLRAKRQIEALRERAPFAADVVAGLTTTPKRISPKYLYDAAGAELFERITGQPEYYPTRTELQILQDNVADIVALIPSGGVLIEFGSGSSAKTRTLLRAATQLAAYVPIDISAEYLEEEAERLREEFPRLEVVPIVADFVTKIVLPDRVQAMPRVGFFPGSTIGNFEPHEASGFLTRAAELLGPEGKLIVGVDLVKDVKVLNAAYNDAAGVTEAFNLNLLKRINRELGANFDLATFEHHAFFNSARNRIEMHLASTRRQKVRVDGETVLFRAGETIHTESSYKYTLDSFGALARGCGWTLAKVWTDPKRYFSVQVLTRAPKPQPRD